MTLLLPYWKKQKPSQRTMKTLFTTFLCALVMSFTALAPNELQAAAPATAEKVVVPETHTVLNPWFDTAPRCHFAVRAPPVALATPNRQTLTSDTADPAQVLATYSRVAAKSLNQGGISALCAWWHQGAFQTYPMLC